MPLPRLTRHAGRRLLATGAIAAVAVLGTPAIASAAPSLTDNPLTDVLGGVTGGQGSGGASTSTPVVPAFPGGGAGGVPDFAGSIQAGAKCFEGLASGIQVTVTGIATGLGEALIGLLGGGSQDVPVTSSGTATTLISLDPSQLQDLLSPEQLQELLAGGQESLTMVVEVVIGGVTHLVDVVLDFVDCLAALVPTPAATTTPPASAAPTTQAPAPVAAVTTSAAPAQAVSYPGYAPTGGAPSEDGSPAALVGLGLLTAATGGGALWLRARRGVAG